MTGERPASAIRVEPYARAAHGDGAAKVVEDVYREWGFTWEPRGYHDDVVRPEAHYAPPDAFFDVACEGARVVGTIGGTVHDGTAELKRLYVLASHRRRGVGRLLAERSLAWARARGARRAVLWSDKRFADAHQLYGRLGFAVFSERVCPGDPDASAEFGYALDLSR